MVVDLSRDQLEQLYLPPQGEFVHVDVPELAFFMVDGEDASDRARLLGTVRWLFTVVEPLRLEARRRMGGNFVEPPVEGLFWADDPRDFAAGRKEQMRWRMMIPAPSWVTKDVFADAVAQAEKKLGSAPEDLRLDTYHEGESVQTMVVGHYEKVAAALARRLHENIMPTRNLVPNGPHHEIYLTDETRVAPERQKTVVRQPVRSG